MTSSQPQPGAGSGLDRPEARDAPVSGTLMRGGAMRFGSYATGAAISALTAALMLRALGVEDAGRYFPVVALVGIVGGVAEVGLAAVGLREYSIRRGADLREFFAALLGLRLVLTTAAIAVGALVGWLIGFDSTMIAGVVLVGISFLFTALQTTLGIPLTAALRNGWNSILEVGRWLITLAVVVCLYLASAGLIPFYAAAIPGSLLAALLTAALIRREAPIRPAFRPSVWLPLLREILPYAAAVSLNVIYFRLGAVIVSVFSTDVQAGLYGTAYRVIEVLSAALPTVLITMLPVLARRSQESAETVARPVARLTRATAVLSGLAAVVLWLGAEVVIDVLAGPGYEGAIEPLQIQGLALAANLIVAAMGYGLIARHQHRDLLVANACGVVCAFALTIPLANAHGATGASVALAVTETLLAALYVTAFWRHTPFPFARPVAIAFAGAACGIALGTLLDAGPAVEAAAGAALYLAICAATGLLPLRRSALRELWGS